MKVIAVFAAVLAVSAASPQFFYNGLGYNGLAYNGLGYHAGLNGLTYAASPVIAASHVVAPVATKTQYHAQDEFGQASFGHSEPTQAHAAVRDAAGGVRGSFSYISPEGKTLTTHYVADHNGYRVASNALPVAPAVSVVGPVDTPEVQHAKAQHFAAVAEAQARSGRKKRGIVAPLTYSAAAFPSVYSPALTYSSNIISAAPAVHYSSPALTYSSGLHHPISYATAPAHAVTYNSAVVAPAHAVTYNSAVVAPAHAVTYSAGAHVIAAPTVREATLTKVVNTPGHAVSYRVD